jgi:hypothetical protein
MVAATIIYIFKNLSHFCLKYATATAVDVHMAMAMKGRLAVFEI